MDWFTRILLFPIALIYGVIISVRNAAYESKLIKSTSFNLPVIGVGNLSVGGTGKTPMVEWLIEYLQPFLKIAVLSRGYGRITRGYKKVSPRSSTKNVGDEPLQVKRKYPDTAVAVSESRTLGLAALLMDFSSTQLAILDDAFQHRSIKPGLNILLTQYNNPFFKDYLMPMGRLREWRSACVRADLLIVTKCPEDLGIIEARKFASNISNPDQDKIFFSTISYRRCYSMNDYNAQIEDTTYQAVLLVSGIANPEYLFDHFYGKIDTVYTYEFKDHHRYSQKNIQDIINSYHRIPEFSKALVTTEKDIVKLIEFRKAFEQNGIDIYIQQIGFRFLFGEEAGFKRRVKDFLMNFKR